MTVTCECSTLWRSQETYVSCKIVCFETEICLGVEHSLISCFSGLYEVQLIIDMYTNMVKTCLDRRIVTSFYKQEVAIYFHTYQHIESMVYVLSV